MFTHIRIVLLLLLLVLSIGASAHTLFIKPDTFAVEPQAMMSINLVNGTFIKSESRLRKPMARSVDIVGPGGTEHDLANDDWVSDGKVSVLSAQFSEPGNYVIGVSTRPRKVSLDPETFNRYLRYEGLFDQKEEREGLEETGVGVVERYTKFAKAIVQVGDVQTSNFAMEIGHDVEILPLTNPYALQVGDDFQARVLRDGMPIEGIRVYATHEGYYQQDEEGIFDEAVKTRSNKEGVIEFEITHPGKWYVRFIDLQRESDSEYWYTNLLVAVGAAEKRIVYESKWATLTFEIR
ncbi:MAG: DUF4198 domain-containing protein [Woeseiaceae bacterium]|nr:DUF4198 domain-containing protein [Woeseiaceae bacterium]NIP22091.1 DUF4198 domain-containing protein [Woeseiaceae bacterium]NIS91205.1 DUF4198 domain-containing protein [Woeseiaceae bacterium]